MNMKIQRLKVEPEERNWQSANHGVELKGLRLNEEQMVIMNHMQRKLKMVRTSWMPQK